MEIEEEISLIAGDYPNPESWYKRKTDPPKTRRGRENQVKRILDREFNRIVKEHEEA